MLDLVTTTQFHKDLKKLRKRGADMQKLDVVLQMLCAEKQLTERYRDHTLVGDNKRLTSNNTLDINPKLTTLFLARRQHTPEWSLSVMMRSTHQEHLEARVVLLRHPQNLHPHK